jgi:hypothetical protein
MTASETRVPWVDANQASLASEFARLKRRLGFEPDEGGLAEEIEEMDPPAAIDRLCALFGLSAFERDIVLLCAGVEMDSKLAALCGEAAGSSQRAHATFGLALSALSEPHWSALTPSRPLRRFRLIEIESGHGLTTAALRIDERILHYVAGLNAPDQRLRSLTPANPDPDWIADEHKTIADEAIRILETWQLDPPVLHLCGDDPHGQEDAAGLAARRLGFRLLTVGADVLPAGADLDLFALLWQREALLLPAALLIQCAPAGFTVSARHLAESLPGVLLLASREPLRLNRSFLRLDVNKPLPPAQKQLWERALRGAAVSLNGTLDRLAEQFRLSAKTIFSTGALISQTAASPEEAWSICRSLARPRLEDLAQRIVPMAEWDDLVLPELQIQTLRQLASQVRHRLKVYETWGFSARSGRGLGISGLFAGESGTGKTMAAEVLARELALDMYRIDLSAVVSKYIGETEKNLRLVFDAAEEGGVLLLFDEADALFGKRGEVKDSHDRYANIEVSYLLQRMEAYQGLAILTTNLKSALDKAFQRRLRFTVSFPFPDVAQREAIWRRIFPERTPTEGLDPKKLAQLNVAGGNIRNIALNAAFLAAESGTPVRMDHLLQAAKVEVHKLERSLSEAEIRGWV